jgi:hypothetical protein
LNDCCVRCLYLKHLGLFCWYWSLNSGSY